MQINNGLYSPAALTLILGAILTTLLAWLARRSDDAPRRPGPSGRLLIVLLVGLAANLALLIQAPAGMYLRPAAAAHRFFPAALVAAALLVLLIALDRSRTRRVWFPLLCVVAMGLGVWMIEGSPRPKIDVLTVHRYAIAALRDRDNPYGIRFPNVYRDEGFYAPGMVDNGWVIFGLPYPPLSLLMALPGQALFSDMRYATLAALIVGAALIGYAPRDRRAIVGPLAAVLLLTPRGLFVLEQGWTESFAVGWLGATVYAAVHAPRLVPWMLALLVAVKQHMVLAVPFGLLLVPPPVSVASAVRFLLPSLLVPVLMAVPFLVWDADAFLRSVIWLQAQEPFRADSPSPLSAFAVAGWPLTRDSSVIGGGAARRGGGEPHHRLACRAADTSRLRRRLRAGAAARVRGQQEGVLKLLLLRAGVPLRGAGGRGFGRQVSSAEPHIGPVGASIAASTVDSSHTAKCSHSAGSGPV